MARKRGTVVRYMSDKAGIVQDSRTGEELIFFIDEDLEPGELRPTVGTSVTFRRSGIDMCSDIRSIEVSHLEEIA